MPARKVRSAQSVVSAAAASKSTKASAKKPALLAGGNPQIPKTHGDASVQAYLAAMPGWKSHVGRRLDALIVRTVPGVRRHPRERPARRGENGVVDPTGCRHPGLGGRIHALGWPAVALSLRMGYQGSAAPTRDLRPKAILIR